MDKLLNTQLREDTMYYWLASQKLLKGKIIGLTMIKVLLEIRRRTNPQRKIIQNTMRLRAAIIETADNPHLLKAELVVPTNVVVDAKHLFRTTSKEVAA